MMQHIQFCFYALRIRPISADQSTNLSNNISTYLSAYLPEYLSAHISTRQIDRPHERQQSKNSLICTPRHPYKSKRIPIHNIYSKIDYSNQLLHVVRLLSQSSPPIFIIHPSDKSKFFVMLIFVTCLTTSSNTGINTYTYSTFSSRVKFKTANNSL